MLQRVVIDPSCIHPPVIVLDTKQQHYLGRVLRLKVGDRFIAMDGQGHSWLAQLIAENQSNQFRAEILEPLVMDRELPIPVKLVIALPKGNTLDDIVRQVTEIGVKQIIPVISDRTLLKPSPQKLERWRRIAQEAAEQAERRVVPDIQHPMPFWEYLEEPQNSSATTQHFLGVTRHQAPHLLDCLLANLPASITIAIGPEGGWTEAEIEAAIAVGYQPISLGNRILRTATAPVVAMTLIAAEIERGTVSQ